MDQYNEPAIGSSHPQPTSSQRTPVTLAFDGRGSEFAIIVFKNLILTVLTLGIYATWGKVNSRKYMAQHTIFTGHRFQFTGNGLELFIGRLKMIGVIIAFVAVMIALQHFVHPMAGSLAIVFVMLFAGYATYQSFHYRLTRTNWRGISLGLEESQAWHFARMFFGGYLLLIVTLGLALPWFDNNIYKLLINNMRFGSMRFRYTGKASDLYGTYIACILLFPFTIGISMFYLMYRISVYRLEHTFLGSKEAGAISMHLKGKFGEFFGHMFLSTLLVLLTFGLALPWVICQNLYWVTTHLQPKGEIDFSQVQFREFKNSGAMFDGGG